MFWYGWRLTIVALVGLLISGLSLAVTPVFASA
jgi:hypothetical protein